MNLLNVCRQGTRLVAIAFLTTIFGFLSACGGGGGSSGPPTLTSIEVSAASGSVALGTTDQLTATGVYSDNSHQTITSSVTWSSSNTAIATVSASGLVTPVAEGSSTITATMSSISGTTSVTVTAAAVTAVAVTPASKTLAKAATRN